MPPRYGVVIRKLTHNHKNSMDLNINGRVAVITGASTGIGLATAKLLDAEGVHLVLTDIEGTDWSPVSDQLGERYSKIEADLTTQSHCKAVVDQAIQTHGKADILIHTAGITGAKGNPLEMSDEDWLEAWRIDFFSMVRMCREIVPGMRAGRWGRIVGITSENVVQPYWEEAVYNTAKAALTCFIKNLSKEEGKHNVLCNTVAPAFIKTPMTDGMMKQRSEEMNVSVDQAVESFLERERPGIAMKRRGRVEEVAPVIALLVSEHASFINGSNYRIDGGSVMTANY